MTHTRENCIFCAIISGKAPAHIIRQDQNVITFLSLEGHPLVVPKAHIPDVFSLDPENAAHIMREAVAVSNALREVCNCDGINLIQSNGSAAGQDVFHFHMHIKPRWKNDGVIIRWNTDAEEERKRLELGRQLRARL